MTLTTRTVIRTTALLTALAILTQALHLPPAFAQPKPAQSDTPRAAGPAMPDVLKMNALIRTTLIALSQANTTGNYSVLRDLGAPDFQLNNTQARLTDAFAELRRRNLDFSPIIFFDPKLVREPAIDDAGRLRLTGFIDTQPEQVTFDMMFSLAGGTWRLYGLAVEMRANRSPAPAQQTSTAPSPPGQPAPVASQPAAKSAPAKGWSSTSKPAAAGSTRPPGG